MSRKLTLMAGAGALAATVGLAIEAVRRGVSWGATPQERARDLPGDRYLEGDPGLQLVMTRAASIDAPPEVVWLWLAQFGRGAGWYSIDRVDNGGLTSARHIVSWIPEPRIGDVSAIGYVRALEPGRGITWYSPPSRFAGARARAVFDFELGPEGAGSRLVTRASASATGLTAALMLAGYAATDSLMAIRMLQGFKRRAERYGSRASNPDQPETGERDQFQLYESIFTSGDSAGRPGMESARRWRDHVLAEGIVAR